MQSTVLKLIGNLLSLADTKLSTLIYHRVLPVTDDLFPGEVTESIFEQQIIELKKVFRVLSVNEAIAQLKKGKLPRRSICITFDDGYADNEQIALPILIKHGVPATFFIATGYLNGGRMFNDTIIHGIRHCPDPIADLRQFGLGTHGVATLADKRTAIANILAQLKYYPLGTREDTANAIAKHLTEIPPPDNLMMNTSQLINLHRAGMAIGAHTSRHPIFTAHDIEQVQQEIIEGREYLENVLGTTIHHFAYPNGKLGQDYTHEHAKIVEKLGFGAAFSTNWGYANKATDLYHLPRFTPYTNKQNLFTLMLFRNILAN